MPFRYLQPPWSTPLPFGELPFHILFHPWVVPLRPHRVGKHRMQYFGLAVFNRRNTRQLRPGIRSQCMDCHPVCDSSGHRCVAYHISRSRSGADGPFLVAVDPKRRFGISLEGADQLACRPGARFAIVSA